MTYSLVIATNSDWVTAIRYYRGLESSKADVFLRTKKPVLGPSLATVAYWFLVVVAIVVTLVAVAINFG